MSTPSSKTPVDLAAIQQAHQLYGQLTGQTLRLAFDRERMWDELLWPVTPSRTCAPSSLISSAKSTLSAVTWVPSNSPTGSSSTASRKTSRLVACACAHPLRPSPHRHPAPASTPLGPNRAASVLWSACANSRQHSAEKCPPALILPTFLPPPQPPITATHFPSNTVIRLTAKTYRLGLLRSYFQPILRQPLRECPLLGRRFVPILEARHQVVRQAEQPALASIPFPHPILEPLVQDIVPIHVGQHG